MEIEEKVSNTPWQIRCSPEQKRFFQKFVEATGLNAQEAIARAFEAFKIQSSDDSQSKKVLFEFDSMIERLQSMMRSQIIVALEKQKQCDEEKTQLESEKSKYQSFYDETLSKIKTDFETEKTSLKMELEEKFKTSQIQFEIQLKNKELEFVKFNEKYEKLDADFQRLDREKSTLQKQYTESMRSYEISDERLMECRLKIKELEEKLRNFEATKEKNSALEKENTILQLKLDSLAKEEALKREYLEKDLRREFEMKLMQLNQVGH